MICSPRNLTPKPGNLTCAATRGRSSHALTASVHVGRATADGHDDPVSDAPVPMRVVNAVAPIRICDNGGWTDTWFGGPGKVFNIGVSPYVKVQIHVHPVGALPDR